MRRSYKGNTRPTTLVGDLAVGATALTLLASDNYPDGSGGPFVLTLDAGLAGEEKVLVAARSGNVCSGLTRGYDGTAAGAHSSGAPVAHTISAVDLDEANGHVNNTTGDVHPQYLLKTGAASGYAAVLTGLLSARPTANVGKRFYVVTSGTGAGSVYYDNGSAWKQVDNDGVTASSLGVLPLSGGTLTGAVTGTDFLVGTKSLPRGKVSSSVTRTSTTSVNSGSGTVVVISCLVSAPVNGRNYEVVAYGQGLQTAAASQVAVGVVVNSISKGFVKYGNLAVNEPWGATGVFEYQATSNTPFSVQVSLVVASGTMTIDANQWNVYVKDVGA